MLEHNFPMDTIAMKFLLPLLLLFPLSTLADDKDYDQCILDYQRTAKSGVAVHFITQACDKLYNDGSLPAVAEKAYYECLLENLPGWRTTGGAEDQERLRIEVAELIWRGGERK
ncbi:hypothetical protein P4234_13810 [Pseudomonas aeruginosa]|nr:hypothetical protein [Pseudomonas aeruginosa]